MKKLALALITVIASAQAEARSIKTYLEAGLDQFQIQPESYISRNEITGARVLVKTIGEKSITLHIDFKSNCPVNAMCIAMMPPPLEVTVPLQKIGQGGCEETIYKGAVDQRPVDGIRQELTVVDNSTNTCKYFAAIPMTEVVLVREGYDRFEGGRFHERHVLTGEKLH